jgi:membrane carboxypeptidase/penicillin-binding protein
MQVARNFFLTREKTVTRKLREVLLAWKIEANLTKDEILELYVNQIFLGQRAYGFAAASQIYFGRPLKDVTVPEAAMLAACPRRRRRITRSRTRSAPRRGSSMYCGVCMTSSSSMTPSSRKHKPRH